MHCANNILKDTLTVHREHGNRTKGGIIIDRDLQPPRVPRNFPLLPNGNPAWIGNVRSLHTADRAIQAHSLKLPLVNLSHYNQLLD